MGKRNFITSAVLACFLASLLGAGCYHLSDGGSSGINSSLLPASVPIFKNTTAVEGIEVPVTESIVRKISYYGADKVVNSEKARTIIEGTVTGYQLDSAASDKRHKVVEYRMSLTLNVLVRDTVGNEVLYKNENFSGFYDFKVPRDSISRKREESRALELLSNKMATALVKEIFEGF